jgi:nuclear GTP-binding protein
VRQLSKEYPTLAFHASITNSFGKGSLIALLRQFAILHSDRKQVSVGFIGYPNTGKSSIINTLRKKQVCTTAPIPGETKIWQYITLTRRIYLIDCPGVVPPNPNDTDAELLLRGVVRVERVENPSQYITAMMSRCQKRHIERTYGVKDWDSDDHFLELLARKSGRLLSGGDADADAVAKMVLNDFMRGKIPWYVAPVRTDDAVGPIEGRLGALGEQRVGGKRKWADSETVADAKEKGDQDEDDFEGFGEGQDDKNEEEIKDDDSVAASEDSFLDDSDDSEMEAAELG